MRLCGGNQAHDGADEERCGRVDEHYDLGAEKTRAEFLDWSGRGQDGEGREGHEWEDAKEEVPGCTEEEQIFGDFGTFSGDHEERRCEHADIENDKKGNRGEEECKQEADGRVPEDFGVDGTEDALGQNEIDGEDHAHTGKGQ